MGSAAVYRRLTAVREENNRDLTVSGGGGGIRDWVVSGGGAVSGGGGGPVRERHRSPLDIVGLPGYQKTTEEERLVCSQLRLSPDAFLEIKQVRRFSGFPSHFPVFSNRLISSFPLYVCSVYNWSVFYGL